MSGGSLHLPGMHLAWKLIQSILLNGQIYEISVFQRRLTIWRWSLVGGLPESPLYGQRLDKMGDLSLERLPLISVHKWLWWTLTSHSFDTAFLCNQFEYFLCFVLFPPFAIFASKTHNIVMSPWLLKQISFGGRAVVFKFIFLQSVTVN